MGRGAPEVAADAGANTGYRVVVDGAAQVIGGTSAAAPLWAGLLALVDAAAGRPSGPPHAVLYVRQCALRDTVASDDASGGVGYYATKGRDAFTGLGAPLGTGLRPAPGLQRIQRQMQAHADDRHGPPIAVVGRVLHELVVEGQLGPFGGGVAIVGLQDVFASRVGEFAVADEDAEAAVVQIGLEIL